MKDCSSPIGNLAAIEDAISQAREDERAKVMRDVRAGRKVTCEPGEARRPGGLVLALQYWSGDEARALELARLIADIEPRRRCDCILALCGRFDCALTPELWETTLYCARKMPVMNLRSKREGVGHPMGCNELWSGTMQALAEARDDGRLRFESAFTFEADGVPLSRNWIDRLIRAHRETLKAGKRVTGALMESHYTPHINGNLVAHLSVWRDRPSLHATPPDAPWDVHHAQVLMHEARPSNVIRNEYGSVGWTEAALVSLARESAWLHGAKDNSAWEYAQSLIAKGDDDVNS